MARAVVVVLGLLAGMQLFGPKHVGERVSNRSPDLEPRDRAYAPVTLLLQAAR
jgi:hypothetical protein